MIYEYLRKIYGNTIGFWQLKNAYAKYIGFWNGKKRLKLTSIYESERIIANTIKSKEPFMLSRYGSVEFRNLFNNEMKILSFNAGFFPRDDSLLEKFRKVYMDSSKNLDFLAIWNYQNHFLNKIKLLKQLPNIKNLVPLRTFEIDNNQWIKELKDKRILVIHPFKKTIEYQYNNKVLNILPRLKSLEVIKAIQTIAGEKDNRFQTWFDAIDYMKEEIDKKDFDIAIIGCGAYGLPLAAYVKSKGKQALHFGGGTQLLFGIIGNRWKKKIANRKGWINPLPEDIPTNSKHIEGGCYW